LRVKEIALGFTALAALVPGAARADDAGLAGAVAPWSLEATGPAKALQKIDASTSTTPALSTIIPKLI
jgi:hypothetical protein